MNPEYGKLWPGMIYRVGEEYEATYKMKSERFKKWAEAETWILEQKENDGKQVSPTYFLS